MNPPSFSLWTRTLALLAAILAAPHVAVCAEREAASFSWVGRWEDGTGYFVDISKTEKGYRLFRSGDMPVELEFVGLTKREFIYRESDPEYVHILRYKSKDEIQDVWFDLDNNSVWDVSILRRKK